MPDRREPLGAFIAAYVGIFFGHMVSGKTKVDILGDSGRGRSEVDVWWDF